MIVGPPRWPAGAERRVGSSVTDRQIQPTIPAEPDRQDDGAAVGRAHGGILDELAHDLAHQQRLDPKPDIKLRHPDAEGEALGREGGDCPGMRLAQHGGDRGRLLGRLGDRAFDPRQLYDVGDAGQQLPAGADDLLRGLAIGGTADRAIHLALDHLAIAENGGERRAQIMAGFGQEARLVGVRLIGIHPRALGPQQQGLRFLADGVLRLRVAQQAQHGDHQADRGGRRQRQHDPMQDVEFRDFLRDRDGGGTRERFADLMLLAQQERDADHQDRPQHARRRQRDRLGHRHRARPGQSLLGARLGRAIERWRQRFRQHRVRLYGKGFSGKPYCTIGGSSSVMVVPRPGWVTTRIWPLWSSISALVMARPSPTPSCRCVVVAEPRWA